MSTLEDHRWVGVGQSGHPDARAAGLTAAAAAMKREDPRLLVVFASDQYDLPVLLAAINEVSGGAPLIGCSTAGEIATSGPTDASAVVVAFGGPGFTVATSVATGLASRLRGAGADVAACIAAVEQQPHRVLLLLSDGLAGDQQELLRGVYSVTGAEVPLVGGCAGDDLKMTSTAQFHGHEVLTDAVVAAAIGSDAPMGIGVRHGWREVGEPMLVTRSANNRVETLDDRPAVDVYLERLGAPREAHTDPAAFTAFALTHPLGLRRRIEEPSVRFVTGADFDTRALLCVAEVPAGGLAWIMEGDERSVLAATDAACRDALAALGVSEARGVLAFDCIARRGVLGDVGIAQEVNRIATLAGGAPVAGFYTYGEIARTRGVFGFHNQTLVVLAVA